MFTLSILTPEKRVLTEKEIDEVVVPGGLGQMDILPGHSPLVSTLAAGVVRYRLKDSSQSQSLAVSWGYLEVHANGVVILAETAELPAEVDRARAEQAMKDAQNFLGQMTADPAETEKYQRKIERAAARLELLDSERLSH